MTLSVAGQVRAVNAPRAAVIAWALSAVMAAATGVLLLVGGDGLLPRLSSDIFSGIGGAAFLVLAMTFATVGLLVVLRVPGNRIGWIFCVTGLLICVNGLTWRYADVGLHTDRHLPGATVAAVVNSVIGEQIAGWIALSLLLFPDGRLPTRRWWPALVTLWAGMALLVMAGTLTPGAYDDPFAAVSNPLGIPGARPALDAGDVVGWLLVLGGIASGSAALVVRLRRARGVERQQLKVVVALGSCAATIAGLCMATWLVWPHGGLPARMAVLGFCFAAFPVAAGFAILRRGLYGIDVAINRTLVYGSVTAVLAVVFAATTLLLGTAVGRGSAWATAGATLVVAVAFRPLRERVQDAVDRRYNRARYDGLRRMAAFLDDLRAGRAAPEDVEQLLRELLSDPRLELLFFLPESELYVTAQGAPAAEDADDDRERVPIERDGQPLAVVLHRHAGGDQPALLQRFVEAGGLAIEIARLRVELRRQLAEVEASRARIVTAAHEERGRIERDLHDGAQQRLVTIGLTLRHAQHELASPAPERAGTTLDAAVAEIAGVIDGLRELARGLPPAQLDRGLAEAFRELGRRAAPLHVDVRAPPERFPRDVEAAAYFIGCEGLTNAVKHARASKVTLSAQRDNGTLVVAVSDDGIGGAAPAPGSGLTGLVDRVAALGGSVRLDSAAGAGTTLTVELPCAS